jgi:hypothetical protein
VDENKLKKICELALDTSYSGVTITEFRAIPTQRFDTESCKWVPDSYSLFIMAKKGSLLEFRECREIENFLETLFGFEVCVDFS